MKEENKNNILACCITTFNSEKYIEASLLSCINQDEQFDQIIVVDDCSTDSTIEIVNNLLKKIKIKIDV